MIVIRHNEGCEGDDDCPRCQQVIAKTRELRDQGWSERRVIGWAVREGLKYGFALGLYDLASSRLVWVTFVLASWIFAIRRIMEAL